MMLYICLKFYEKNIWNSFQLAELTQVYGRDGYFQYLLRSKGGNSKNRIVFCTFPIYICEKFHENISNGFQRTERTQVHGK